MTHFGSILQDALAYRYPDGGIVCGESYESIQWIREDSKPSLEEVEALVADFKLNEGKYRYEFHRESEYPRIDEVVAALIEKEEGSMNRLIEVMRKRAEVRAKWPKPTI